ncbi:MULTISPECIES: cell division protein FtsQ/DivIB [Mycolicibacterium]|uniref:cell division protein FtsQ/DivIB n=1 Tax=Mycolicibacterium TaxID=1866885 RepID=UPI00055E1980|nr:MULTISPECIES: FtsQ-type POTRA domain-containing protein [Mycolicibacterium]QZY44201.1 FtsQ-type POTRA domain-containing protein [Mycolicibacterium austroafricanum]UJL27924.1 FtsQ-type POTRA domain-containing protein [Mycolicibacterium vanbaalenii]WND54611.1 FtsQ-type POTRA domain-containing protein [Mycolicibacterium vanbaalenii]
MTDPTDDAATETPVTGTPAAETPAAEAAAPETPAPETQAPEEDFEGPRRRARREREERRAAQARATAIEAARREAKRRALGKQQPQTRTLGRGTVRGLKVLMWTALTAVLVVALGLLLYFTPIMSARSIVVTGVGAVTQEEVVAAAAVAPGTPLLQVNTDGVAERVAGIRRIASARVQRQYPSTLRITVIERVPVVLKDYPDGVHLFDRDGVDFATAPPPPGIPYLDTENPGPSDPATQAALQVMTSLRPDVASQVGRVSAPSVAAITLTLVDGRTVVWGTTDRTEEKALKLAALLTQPGQVYDVSSPDLPTVK